jgi:endonuclease/exonuclease/phosphatase family metal-dependent hydrolase
VNDTWCAAVGPAVIYSSAGSSVQAGELAVITWNTHVGAGDLEGFVESLRRGDFTAGRPVQQFVLLLQEVLRAGSAIPMPMPTASTGAGFIGPSAEPGRSGTPIESLARRFGADAVYVPSMRNGPGPSDRGNAIVSTVPIDTIDFVELPLIHQRRVAIAARLKAAGGPRVRVVSVHLDTAIALRHGGPAQWRRRQTRALLDVLANAAEPTVIGGDLNTWWGSDEPAVRDLRGAFRDTVDRRRSQSTWRGPLGAGGALDHIFAGGFDHPVHVSRINKRYGSDHYPLIAFINIGN